MGKPYFLIEDRSDPLASAARLIVEGEYALFGTLIERRLDELCMDTLIRQYQHATGKSKRAIESAICAYTRLAELPGLRALQQQHRFLDLPRLIAIDEAICRLGSAPESEHLLQVDALLVQAFTPSRQRQHLPGPTTITRRIRTLISQLFPAVGCNEKARKQREQIMYDPIQPQTVEFYEFTQTNAAETVTKAAVEITADFASINAFEERIHQVAKEQQLTLAEASVAILTGEVDQQRVILYGFTPLNEHGERTPGTPIYLPHTGWTNPEATAILDEQFAQNAPEIVPLEEISASQRAGYKPTEEMRKFAFARDGVCIYPGCEREAHRCQLDHRIPYGDGGETTPQNLFSLCQHHHNIKTDRRAFYVPDPVTGDIVWLFPDGTYALTQPEGLLNSYTTPVNPRWQESAETVKRRKAKNAEFFARAHKLCDEYSIHGDKEQYEAQIAQLEEQFGREFAYEETPDLTRRIRELVGGR